MGCRSSSFFIWNLNGKDEYVDAPCEGNHAAGKGMFRQPKGNSHQHGYGNHDAQLLCGAHTAPAVLHQTHGLLVEQRTVQPPLHAVGAARKAPSCKQNERNGRQHREECTYNTEDEAQTSKYCKKSFSKKHLYSF